MLGADTVFLHAPALYDFRSRPVLLGPISDVIPSGPIFEMYPIGVLSLCGHLEKAGFSTRVVNLATKMLRSAHYDPEREIGRLRPKAFAIDLHWLPHVQGSLRVGEMVKKLHPDVPIIYGGYSATYFHSELIRYPFVDYVLKGDSTELPMVRLMEAIAGRGDLGAVPNLTRKDERGEVISRDITWVPSHTEDVMTEYDLPIRKFFRFFDLEGYLPFRSWLKYPITAVFPYRGCMHNCQTCGGSRFACQHVFNREGLSPKSPKKLASELKAAERYFNAPCMIVGDLLQAGRSYAEEALQEIKKARLRNEIALEFFVPPPRDFIARIAEAIPHYNIEISPESHDESIRRSFGRPFSNDQLEACIRDFLAQGCNRIDLFFMIGLSGQTASSVMETVDYCDSLLGQYGQKRQLHPFIAPLAPFVDPGSQVWENPQKYGYRMFARTLEEHRRLMESAPSWKYFLNYETRWMSRDEIVQVTYAAGLCLNELKRRYELLSEDTARRVAQRATEAVHLMETIDAITKSGGRGQDGLKAIAPKLQRLNAEAVFYKEELNWPAGFYRFNLLRILALGLRTLISNFRSAFGRTRIPRKEGR